MSSPQEREAEIRERVEEYAASGFAAEGTFDALYLLARLAQLTQALEDAKIDMADQICTQDNNMLCSGCIEAHNIRIDAALSTMPLDV